MDEKETKLISLSEVAKEIGRTSEYLNFLVRQGKLKAEKKGRNWYTTREWVDVFLIFLNSPKNKPGKKKQAEGKNLPNPLNVLSVNNVAVSEEKIFQGENNSRQRRASSLAYTPRLATEIKSRACSEVGTSYFQSRLSAEINSVNSSLVLRKKSFWSRLATGAAYLLVFFLISLSGLFVVSFFLHNQESQPEELAIEISEDTFLARDENGAILSPGKVMGEETEGTASAVAASQNFRMQEISFGGIVLASSNEESLPLEITDFKTKIFLTKDGKEAQALISWRTNKLAVSEISYAKINSPTEKKLQETDFAFNHSVILTKLDLDSTYTINVQARDHWDNRMISDKFSIYTGSKAISVFDLIAKEINAVFGWAIK